MVNAVLWASARRTGWDYWQATTRARWDSSWYLLIVARGSELKRCTGGPGHAADIACGTAGWFPTYPAGMWLLNRLSLPSVLAGVVIAEIFGFLMLVLIWNGFLLRSPAFTAALPRLLALGLAGFWFGQVYYHAVFPMAPTAFFLLLALYCLRDRRWLLAGAAGAAAASLYPTGVFICLIAALWVVSPWTRLRWQERICALLLGGALPAMGLLVVIVYQQHVTGDWAAYVKAQAGYGHGLNSPLDTLRDHLHFWFSWGTGDIMAFPAWQAVIVAGVTVCGLAALPVVWRRDLELGSLLGLAMLVLWISPLVIGKVNLYRADSLMIPAAVLLGRLPTPLLAIILLLAAAVSYKMGILYFRNSLS